MPLVILTTPVPLVTVVETHFTGVRRSTSPISDPTASVESSLVSNNLTTLPTSSTTAIEGVLTPASNPTASVEISLVTSTITALPMSTITTLPTSSTTAIDTSKPGELSSGAKVGITVGSTIIGLSLFIGIMFLVLRSKRREQNTHNETERREEEASRDRAYQKAELSNDHMRHEMPEMLLQELPGERQLYELAGGLDAIELYGEMLRSRTELGAGTPVPSGSEGERVCF